MIPITTKEAIKWLNRFDDKETYLSYSSLVFWKRIKILWKNKILDNIEHHIRDLVNICDHSNYVNEEAEVCLRCGEMYFDLKKVEESIKLLQGAVSGYQNHRHNQTVARWVLGIVMWEETDDHKEAIIQWKNCKETYRHLEDYHRFEREKVEWYQKIISEMDQALEEAIKQNTLINKNIYLLNNNNNV